MSLLNSASLVVTPNGYKEGTLYSVIPNTTLGDMTVVRATTATRVNADGLIELVPYNLLRYSEQFDNAAWSKIALTVTSNATTAPNGTLTADKLVENTTNTNHYLTQFITNQNSLFTYSVYAKKAERDFIFINAFATTPNNFTYVPFAYFNLSNGTIGTVSNCNASIQDAGNGWYRCTIQCTSIFVQTSANVAFYNYTAIANNNNSYLGDGTSGIFVWGAQLVTGTLPKDYVRTETRLNIPRLDYSNGTCPSLLVEPQRTNVCLWSEQIDNAGWTKNNSPTITTNIATAPDGTVSADGIQDTTGGTFKRIHQSFSVSANSTNTASVFVKKETTQTNFGGLALTCTGGTTKYAYGIVNPIAGTIVVSSDSVIGATSTKVEDYGDWWRFSLTATDNGSNTLLEIAYYGTLSSNGTTATLGAGSVRTVWGFQLEIGAAYATSYIPTTSAAVTRNVDVISKTGISSLINSTEGVLFAEINALKYPVDVNNWLTITDGTNANSVGIVFETNGKATARIEVGGVGQAFITTSVDYSNFIKVAFKYKENDFAWWVNGVEVGTDLSGITFPSNTLNSLQFAYGSGSNKWAGNVKLLAVFNEALSDSELETLTTI
jgi:hypothetical protein